jgi:hypothetical protein
MGVSKRLVRAALGLLVSVVALGQGQTWKEYVYATDGFAISSPVEPVVQKRTRPGTTGDIEAHFYFTRLEGGQLIVIYAPLLAGDQRTQEQVFQDTRKGVGNAKLLSDKSISLGNYRGIELETDDGQRHQLGRYYLIDRRIYTLAFSVPSGKEFPAEAERWSKSFRIVSATK